MGVMAIATGLAAPAAKEEFAVIETPMGQIVVKFFPDVAPKHVESFKLHAAGGYFNGTTFHRVIPGFVIQGGDPNTRDSIRTNDGQGGHAAKFFGVGDEKNPETWMLPAEFNSRPHKRGALSMARAMDPNSAGSQFFICVADVNRLDGKYTVFGEVVQGMEAVDAIVAAPTPGKANPGYRGPDADNPISPVKMNVRPATDEDLKVKLPK